MKKIVCPECDGVGEFHVVGMVGCDVCGRRGWLSWTQELEHWFQDRNIEMKNYG